MSRDPFLSAHLIGNKCFEVGGEFSPASIRDQMIRAYLLVERAWEEKLIDRTTRKLLVVGAGPSGLTAAFRAAQHGVSVTIVERRASHAFLLGRCTSRDVEPTLYDWPVDHWSQNVFEWTGASMPFRLRSGRANVIALGWQMLLTRMMAAFPGAITIYYNTVVSTTARPPRLNRAGLLDVHLLKAGLVSPHTFGALVSCVGFGGENCASGSYRGLEFWATDDLQVPNCGLSSPPAILISGGGDGALQDFIRVTTLRSSSSALDGLLLGFAHHPWVFDSVQSEIQSAEDVAARALSWNAPRHDDPVLKRLEDAHLAVIARLKRSHAWPAVVAAVLAMMPSPAPRVDLVHRKAFFSQCYPLNRFLALLILEVAGGTVRRRPDTEVVSVHGAHHNCGGNARACHGQTHTVTLRIGGSTVAGAYEVVVLRHGISGPRHLFAKQKQNRLRQLLPYFVEK